MTHTTLISAPELQALMDSEAPLMVFDCSFDLSTPSAAEQLYLDAHIPGAVYAHLDEALSAPHGAPLADGTVLTAHDADTPASGGRHPLPSREKFAIWLSSVGFANGMQAVVYDRNQTAYCGRLWWMLKWLGHDAVAVLDGGLQAWQAAGGAIASGAEPAHFQSNFRLGEPLGRLVTADQVLAQLGQSGQTVIDARTAVRFRGDSAAMDPVAGHIPGALNRPFADNFAPDGRFKQPEVLRAEFDALLAGRAPGSVVHHCGSGVTANPNLLAMELAGLGQSGLFAGSWSEWTSDPTRPVARGD
ncbi:MAG: sulfurtransferase [Giesbergeria sp.]|nr:sulfurtransferase [Giesbergeria sp.]